MGTALLLATSLITPVQASPAPVVRVMVEREKENLRIQGFDLVLRDAETGRVIAHEDRRASIPFQCGLGGKMNLRLRGGREVRVSGPLRVESLGGFIKIEPGRQYRDDLYVYSFNGDCIVVNHVDLEKYVAGLLNSEMSASWNAQALMAQAIAARSYAIYQMREGSSPRWRGLRAPFDLDSSVKDQVYEGAHKERYKALRAVQLTRGMVLTYEGRPIKAFYHSTCGGHTESAEKVWGGKYPYLRPVYCGNCDRSPRYRWNHEVSVGELQRRLWGERLLKGALLSIRVARRNSLDRAELVEVRGSQGSTFVAATKIRDLLGTTSIRSTDFTVSQSGPSYFFNGNGSGHGVGMCQWGAKGMADAGEAYARILKHYYPATEITKIY